MNFEREPDPAMARLRIHHLVDFEFGEVLAWYAGLSPLAADNFVVKHNVINRCRC